MTRRRRCQRRTLRNSPKALLVDQYVSHPIYDLFRLIEEHTAISRGTIGQLAWRLNTPLGLEPLKRTRPPTDPELAGFLDDTRPDLPDLLPVLAKLNECDVNGTTATILRRFEEKHPGVLASFGFIGKPAGKEQGALPQHAGDQKRGEETGESDTGTEPLRESERNAILQAMRPADKQAYFTFQYAESKAGQKLEDHEAYKLIKEEGIPADKGDLGELTDYRLPSFDTWSRQLRNARNALNEQKYKRRGRPMRTRSIVGANQIEPQEDRD